MDDFRLEILKSGKKVLESCRYYVEINEDNYEGHVFSNSETKVDNLINIYPLYKFDENILVENDKMVIIDGS